jgi:hypothetical protein
VSRILLDHNIPDGLRRLLSEHEVHTTYYEGWERLDNGELLAEAERAGFSIFVTSDKGIRHQQNLRGRKIANHEVVNAFPGHRIVAELEQRRVRATAHPARHSDFRLYLALISRARSGTPISSLSWRLGPLTTT